MIPESFALAPVGHIVEQEEIADMRIFAPHVAIVGIGKRRVETAIWEQVEQPVQPRVDQVDTGRFERFEKARRQPDRKAVADPGALAQPGGEAQHSRVRKRFAIEPGQQFLMRIGIGDEVAG